MKITETMVKEIHISDVKNLDPITATLKNYGPGQGEINIRCFGKAWTAVWPAMGKENTIETFFIECDNDYLANKLAPGLERDSTDEDGIEKAARIEILRRRRNDEISKEGARELIDELDAYSITMGDHVLLYKVYGDEWWYCLPKVPNPEYEYLCKIIDTVREGLRIKELA